MAGTTHRQFDPGSSRNTQKTRRGEFLFDRHPICGRGRRRRSQQWRSGLGTFLRPAVQNFEKALSRTFPVSLFLTSRPVARVSPPSGAFGGRRGASIRQHGASATLETGGSGTRYGAKSIGADHAGEKGGGLRVRAPTWTGTCTGTSVPAAFCHRSAAAQCFPPPPPRRTPAWRPATQGNAALGALVLFFLFFFYHYFINPLSLHLLARRNS